MIGSLTVSHQKRNRRPMRRNKIPQHGNHERAGGPGSDVWYLGLRADLSYPFTLTSKGAVSLRKNRLSCSMTSLG